ncbi:MAG TPA: LysR substrate-binding domain-containing protein [Clostridia bacterium]|nr:LysR substrate-binding domain-containing protein [Clostridia bacterium]
MDLPLVAFLEKWGQYVVSFRAGKSTDVVKDVAKSRSILGFLSLNSRTTPYFERVFHERELEFRELATTVEHVFLRCGHPLAVLPEISMTQLVNYPCLTYRQDDIPLRLSESSLGNEVAARTIYVSDRGTMHDFIRHTDGYNVGTGIINPDEDMMLAVPLMGGQQIRMGLIKRRQTFLPSALEDYIDRVTQVLIAASRRP